MLKLSENDWFKDQLKEDTKNYIIKILSKHAIAYIQDGYTQLAVDMLDVINRIKYEYVQNNKKNNA